MESRLAGEGCGYLCLHGEAVEQAMRSMPQEGRLVDLAELFKVFGDATRIRILYVLSGEELCVCDLAQLLCMTSSAISHQLQVLKKSKLVKYRREGKAVFYSLADDHVRTILGQGMEHVSELFA